MPVTIELFGIARSRAGVAEVEVEAATLKEALRALLETCPGLAPEVLTSNGPAPGYLLSLDGQEFLDDPGRALPDGARLLLLSAQAGG